MPDTTQDKTEQPTQKRIDDAAEKGQIAYSKELTGALVFIIALGSLQLTGGEIFDTLAALFRKSFALPMDQMMSHTTQWDFLGMMLKTGIMASIPIFLVAFAAALGPGLAQAGIRLSMKKIMPDPNKLNPIKGIKKLFSLDSFVTAMQNLFKMGLVCVVMYVTLDDAMPKLNEAGEEGLLPSVALVTELVFLVCFRVAGGLVILGVIDILYRRWKHTKDLMMTKEEVKEERKKMEGDPRIKGRIREVQRTLAMQRMKQDVQEADVVVRNPTHFAVALKYDTGNDAAPRVVAKGRALMALSIIRIAEEAGVRVVSNKPLARELYRVAPVGTYVPEHLFVAVAEVLAVVFKDRSRNKTRTATG